MDLLQTSGEKSLNHPQMFDILDSKNDRKGGSA